MAAQHNPPRDFQYKDKTITKVESCDDGKGWTITTDDLWSFFVPPESPIVPQVGNTARFYGRGLGYPVRGLFIHGQRVFYRTEAEEEERHKQWCAELDAQRARDFEANRAKLDADYETLPQAFKDRLDGFRTKDGWRVQHEAYEMSACLDAVRISALGTPEAIDAFYKLPWAEQQTAVPGLFDGHSGNSFGAACMLAKLYLHDASLVPKAHGALCPLVGCKNCGCWSVRNGESS